MMKVKNYVYMLRYDGEVVYVGVTENKTTLVRRMVQHLPIKHFNAVDIIHCPDGDGLSVESKLILKYQPKYNHGTSCSDEYRTLPICVKELEMLIKSEFDVAKLKNKTYLKKLDLVEIKNAIKATALRIRA